MNFLFIKRQAPGGTSQISQPQPHRNGIRKTRPRDPQAPPAPRGPQASRGPSGEPLGATLPHTQRGIQPNQGLTLADMELLSELLETPKMCCHLGQCWEMKAICKKVAHFLCCVTCELVCNAQNAAEKENINATKFALLPECKGRQSLTYFFLGQNVNSWVGCLGKWVVGVVKHLRRLLPPATACCRLLPPAAARF